MAVMEELSSFTTLLCFLGEGDDSQEALRQYHMTSLSELVLYFRWGYQRPWGRICSLIHTLSKYTAPPPSSSASPLLSPPPPKISFVCPRETLGAIR